MKKGLKILFLLFGLSFLAQVSMNIPIANATSGSIASNSSNFPYLKYSINSIYFYDPSNRLLSSDPCIPIGGHSGSGIPMNSDFAPNGEFNENATIIMTALLNAGYSQVETAGIIGSLMGESTTFNPREGENGQMGDVEDDSFRITDSQCYNRCGFGIAQWTSGNRQDNLQAYADRHGLPVVSLEAQIGFLIEELASYDFAPGSTRFGATGNDASSAGTAAVQVCNYYERPSGSCEPRRTYGQDAFNFMQSNGGGGSGGTSSSDESSSSGGTTDDQCSSSGGSDSGCGSGEAIATKATELAWPTIEPSYRDATEAFKQTANDLGMPGNIAKDCGKFASVVIRAATGDMNFPAAGTWIMQPYMEDSALWESVPNIGNESNLLPGDVLIFNANGGF